MSPEQGQDVALLRAGENRGTPWSPGNGLWRHGAKFASFSVIGGGVFVAGFLFQAGLTIGLQVPSLASYIVQTIISVQASYFLNRWFTWKTAQASLWPSFFAFTFVNYMGADKLVFMRRTEQKVTMVTSPPSVITGPVPVHSYSASVSGSRWPG